MSAQAAQSNSIQKSYPAKGSVTGKIGEHSFETSNIDVSRDKGIVMVTATHRDDDGSSEVIYFEFADTIQPPAKLSLGSSKPNKVWVAFVGNNRSPGLPYETGEMGLDVLVSHPFNVKGYIVGSSTEDQNLTLNIKFELEL